MSDWWVGVAPAEHMVPCGGERHRLRWEQGRLVACDHGDPDDELALAALGGEQLECLELVGAWERHRDDLRALVIGPRDGADHLRPGADAQPAGRGATGRSRSGTRSGTFGARRYRRVSAARHAEPSADLDDLAELITLTALGGGLGERLVATVAAEWAARLQAGNPRLTMAGRPDPADATTRLRAALYGRVCATLRSWLGEPQVSLELEMTDAEHPRSLSRVGDAIHAQLPFAWLLDVWAKDLTVVHGRFCLDAQLRGTAAGEHWELATVAPDLRAAERIELRIRPVSGG